MKQFMKSVFHTPPTHRRHEAKNKPQIRVARKGNRLNCVVVSVRGGSRPPRPVSPHMLAAFIWHVYREWLAIIQF